MSEPKYKVVTGDSAENLAFKVNGHIAAGWQPLGGVAVTLEGAVGGGPVQFWCRQKNYVQAMTKEAEKC